MKMNSMHMTIKAQDNHLRNELHFNIQKSTRANVFRDRTKYTRKVKHKPCLFDY